MQNDLPVSLGSTGANAFFWIPPLPPIVAEWAALIPLILHLAGAQDDHRMVGEAALRGSLNTGMFPKLGHLNGIARLLHNGPDFLDFASSKGALSSTVWDVSWGSVFPCSNGAARALFTTNVLKKRTSLIDVEQYSAHLPGKRQSKPIISAPTSRRTAPEAATRSSVAPRRPQTLHVFDLVRGQTKPSLRSWYHQLSRSRLVEGVWLSGLLCLTVVLCLFGVYGSASIVLSSAISRVVCHYLPVERPPGYLGNNEAHDACMLAAVHENASTWYLYTGDRGIVDWLLNKTMISVRPNNRFLHYYFRLAHCFQLSAMTYVAAQKGWDGVCLLSLMMSVWIVHWSFGDHQLASKWAQIENIHVESRSFELGGRTTMIGAIQLLNDRQIASEDGGRRCRNPAWMDGIIAPCARRSLWTEALLRTAQGRQPHNVNVEGLEEFDQQWVERTTRWSRVAADCIATEMSNIRKPTV